VSLQLDDLRQLELQQMELQQLHIQAQLQCRTVQRQLSCPPSSFGTASVRKQLQYRQQLEQQQAQAWALHELLQQQEAEVQAREAELQATAQAAGLSELVLRELQQQVEVEAYELQAELLLPQQLQAFQQQQVFQQQQQQQHVRRLCPDAEQNDAAKLSRLQAALRRGMLRQSLAAAVSLGH
jgi:hypothetical protein